MIGKYCTIPMNVTIEFTESAFEQHLRNEKILDNIRQQLWKERALWLKALPQCPPNAEKKSPVVEQNASTSSTGNTNTIQLQVPKQHRNATLSVQINPLTREPEMYYAYQDANDILHGVVFKPQPKPREADHKRMLEQMKDNLAAPYDHEGAPAKFFTGDTY